MCISKSVPLKMIKHTFLVYEIDGKWYSLGKLVRAISVWK